ncbi:hypothetical protein KAW18_12555, partial [candidate division WOR-3 bacterium]|nr:hypothetical protein [candidate division WOR-3 bacterium]
SFLNFDLYFYILIFDFYILAALPRYELHELNTPNRLFADFGVAELALHPLHRDKDVPPTL